MGSEQAIEITFDLHAYSIDAIQRAAYGLASLASAEVRLRDADIICTLRPRTTPPIADLADRLRDSAIDEALRERIREETADVRNLILSVAYSRIELTDD